MALNILGIQMLSHSQYALGSQLVIEHGNTREPDVPGH